MLNEVDARAIPCPYCGETIEILIDCSISAQNYIEDCEVCCRPISFAVRVDEHGYADVSASHEDE